MSLDDVQLNLVDSVDNAMRLMTWLGERRPTSVLGADIETSGFSLVHDRLRLVQIGDEMTGWSIPWEQWGGVFTEVARKWDGWWVGHNFIFDTGFLDRAGVIIPRDRIHDTRPLAHILEPTYSTALKNLSARFIDSRAAAMQEELDRAIGAKGGWTWGTVPIDYGPYWQYGALDPVLTARLFALLHPRVEADGSMKAYTDVELPAQWVTQRMQTNGAHVDREYAQKYREKYEVYCRQVESWCKNEYGVSPGSNQAIIDVLREEGFDFTKRTKGGATALDADVLAGIDHPLAEAVLQRRKLQKIASTYLSHIIEDADADDIMHPSINPLGARTSRMSMSQPNLQNLPRTSESNPAATTVRNCFTTRYGDDGVLVFCDFDQIEMRGLAHMSQDRGLREAFLLPGDFFVNLARRVYRDDTIDKKHPLRQRVKNVGYAKIYGAGITKMALTAGISVEEMTPSVHAFDSEFTGVRAFQNRVQTTALQRRHNEGVGYVRSPLTHRRHPSDDGKEYALVNYLVQGLAAEMFKMKIVELSQAGLDRYMILPVHDEVIMDVPRSDLPDVINTLKDIMNDDQLLSVPVTAGIATGSRWGEKTDVA